ncbi:Coiled-coil domain-containing protein 81 [Orchesella cincta]|uniref:Coiled-coil domain-containing protein 81 n=1 Tax=Orchesella cincta TaxID=48709 RepID=A0A1D2M754_ORCCI|nr:Coiled-coil domain-containing protein 81 [Orchesella cincta]
MASEHTVELSTAGSLALGIPSSSDTKYKGAATTSDKKHIAFSSNSQEAVPILQLKKPAKRRVKLADDEDGSDEDEELDINSMKSHQKIDKAKINRRKTPFPDMRFRSLDDDDDDDGEIIGPEDENYEGVDGLNYGYEDESEEDEETDGSYLTANEASVKKDGPPHPHKVLLHRGSSAAINVADGLVHDEHLHGLEGAPPTPPRLSLENINELLGMDEMLDDDQRSFVEAVKQHAHTLLERECTVREVILVWENCSKYIILKMLEGFAVKVPGLGTFTLSILPNDLAADKMVLRKHRKFPVFKICQHLKDMYDLEEENALYQCNAPVVALNLSVIASDTKLPRGIVDGIITEVLQSFARGIITNKTLEFPFPYIGKLYILQRRVSMAFYQQFCEGLSFDFDAMPSTLQYVLPGNMSPLMYHRPQPEFQSVFHYRDLRLVEEKIAAKPRPYAKGNFIRDSSESPCNFLQKLHSHSNLLFHCSCCKNEKSEEGDPPCEYSQDYERINKSCCTQHGKFSFQQPDGSSFSPQPLYKTLKTGNPILDRLTDDKCLLQQALGCWLKRDYVHTLGTENVGKHFDRDYFHHQRHHRTTRHRSIERRSGADHGDDDDLDNDKRRSSAAESATHEGSPAPSETSLTSFEFLANNEILGEYGGYHEYEHNQDGMYNHLESEEEELEFQKVESIEGELPTPSGDGQMEEVEE